MHLQISVRTLRNSLFRNDVSYLLAGGLGGLGRAIAQWMVENGAKKIVFLSRTGLKSQRSPEFVKTLESYSAIVTSRIGDVCDKKKSN
jgi:shikimate 5-dehydrogenase